MAHIQLNFDFLAIVIGALLGSAKANTEFGKHKTCIPRLIDLFVGVFCGIALALHFANRDSAALSGGLALLGGVSGTMAIDVFLQMLPSIVKKYIKNTVDKTLK